MRLIDANKMKLECNATHPSGSVWIDAQPTAYDINKVIELIEDYGKYKGVSAPTGDGEWENFISVSVAKQIVREQKIYGEKG